MKKMRYREAKSFSCWKGRAGIQIWVRLMQKPVHAPLTDADPGFGSHVNGFGRFHGFGVSSFPLMRLQESRRRAGLRGRGGEDGMRSGYPSGSYPLAESFHHLANCPPALPWAQGDGDKAEVGREAVG